MEAIIYKAIRELAIEETVTGIVSTWDSLAFGVLKYHRAERRTEVLETGTGSQVGAPQNNRPPPNNGNGNRRGDDSVVVDEVAPTGPPPARPHHQQQGPLEEVNQGDQGAVGGDFQR